MVNKRLINTGVEAAPAVFDPLQNFETVTYTGNGGTQKITGYIRKGGAFNGSSSKVDLPLSVITQDNFSLSFWIYPTVNYTGSIARFVFAHQASSGSRGILFGYLYTGWKVQATNGSNISEVAMSSPTLNTWTHISITYSTTNGLELFVNGVSQGTDTYTALDISSHTGCKLGSRGYSDGEYFEGKIDQVRIFDKAISSSEVTTLYNETYASSTKSTTDIFSDGSGIALYELDGDANDTGLYGSGAIDSGQSAVFNGTSSYINTNNLYLPATADWSVSLWIKPRIANGIGDNAIFTQYFPSATGRMVVNWVGLSGSEGRIQYAIGTYNSRDTLPIAFPTDDIWYHFVIIKNSGGIQIYVNNNQIVTNGSYQSIYQGQPLRIGGDNNWGQYGEGNIDQVRIYDTALSASDIEALASETNVPTANLVAHYKLDGNANDETGSYNGTPTNITYSDPAEFPAYNGTPTNVNFLGMAFQPDLVWIKGRTIASNHALFDVVRGNTKRLESDNSNAESTYSYFSSFDANGFTVGNQAAVNSSSTDYVAWCWKAGGAAVSNTDGDITSQVSANQDAGFSIVKYSGDNNSSSRVGHGLSQTPEMIILKNLSTSYNWTVSHIGLNNDRILFLEDSVDEQSTGKISGTIEAQENHTSETFGFVAGSGTYPLGGVNYTGYDCIAYCFHSVDGYQKVGSYTGTGSAGQKITTGFEPRFVILKKSSSAGSWIMLDNKRDTTNPNTARLYANASDAETNPSFGINILSDGFDFNAGSYNDNAATYIYLAIA